MDLPFTYVLPNGRDLPVEIDNRKVILASALAAGQAFMAHDSATAILELMKAGASALALHDQSVAAQPEKKHSALGSFVSQIAHLALDGQQSAAAPNVSAPQQTSTSSGGFQHAVKEEVVQIRTSLADVVQFSGCRDDQTSADAYIGGVSQGAMTYALLKSFETHGTEISFANLLRSLREILQKGQYKQVPMLSTGMQTEDMNELFWL